MADFRQERLVLVQRTNPPIRITTKPDDSINDLAIDTAAVAVLTKDIPDCAFIIGFPAKQKGWMSRQEHILKAGPKGIVVCPERRFRYIINKKKSVIFFFKISFDKN